MWFNLDMRRLLLASCVAGVLVVVCTVIGMREMDELDVMRVNERRGYFGGRVGRVLENKYVEGFVVGRKVVFGWLDLDVKYLGGGDE